MGFGAGGLEDSAEAAPPVSQNTGAEPREKMK